MKGCSITAIVVTCNRRALLKECLEALEKQKANPLTAAILLGEDLPPEQEQEKTPGGLHFHVMIVDNASTDGTGEYVQSFLERHPGRVTYLPLTDNTGGAGGFYYGMKKAVEEGADYVWIMDDDTIPKPDALEQLLKAVVALDKAGEPFGFLSSDVLWTDGTPCKMNRQLEAEPENDSQRELMERAHLIPVKSATFVSLLIPGAMIWKKGLPLKEYFIWGDDKEYTLRLSDALPCYQAAASQVIHKTKNNAGSSIAEDDLERIHRYYYAYRNDLATAKRRGGRQVLIYYLAYYLNVFRVLFKGREGRKKRLAVMRQGKRDGRRFAPEISYPHEELE